MNSQFMANNMVALLHLQSHLILRKKKKILWSRIVLHPHRCGHRSSRRVSGRHVAGQALQLSPEGSKQTSSPSLTHCPTNAVPTSLHLPSRRLSSVHIRKLCCTLVQPEAHKESTTQCKDTKILFSEYAVSILQKFANCQIHSQL